MNTCPHFKSMTFSWDYSLVICLSTVEPRSGTDGPARPGILLMTDWHGGCGPNGEQMVSISIGQPGPWTQSTIPDLCNSVGNVTQPSLAASTFRSDRSMEKQKHSWCLLAEMPSESRGGIISLSDFYIQGLLSSVLIQSQLFKKKMLLPDLDGLSSRSSPLRKIHKVTFSSHQLFHRFFSKQ